MTGPDQPAETVTPVLIVGGGPVGLALALELAYQGMRSTLIEKATDISSELLAKAGTLSARTLEFCRRWGIADEVSNWGADPDFPRDTVYLTALCGGHLIGRDQVPSAHTRQENTSPEMLRKCPQHIFDPLLARAVQRAGMTDIRYGTEAGRLVQDANGVTVQVRDLGHQRDTTIRAHYVVACDGAASSVREQLGIAFDGPTLDHSVSAMMRVRDLDHYHLIGKATRYMFIGTEGTWANLTSVDYGDLWRFTLVGMQARVPVERLDLKAKVVAALGRDDIPFELMRALPWRRSQCTATSYRLGRVFLAGDAAHTTSPTGGHGLNTGIGDVVGLGWILAAALQGWAGQRLLDSYEHERRSVAIRNGRSSSRNYEAWRGGGMDLTHILDDGPVGDAQRAAAGRMLSENLREEWFADGIRMGYRYEGSAVIVPDGTPEPADDPVTYVPTARPGHRAPHAWLSPGRSVIDLFGRGFTLLTFTSVEDATSALQAAAGERGVPLHVHAIDDEETAKRYEYALVLVRPDGHVAWRSDLLPGMDEARQIIDRIRGAEVVDP
jgi:2-polyprenyl-6-methoxyphenol hydroxylase-like FAD-dependent oxidoreductase